MPNNKQLTNLDRSVMPGNIKLRLWRINLAMTPLMRQFVFPGMTLLSVNKQLLFSSIPFYLQTPITSGVGSLTLPTTYSIQFHSIYRTQITIPIVSNAFQSYLSHYDNCHLSNTAAFGFKPLTLFFWQMASEITETGANVACASADCLSHTVSPRLSLPYCLSHTSPCNGATLGSINSVFSNRLLWTAYVQ